MFTRQAFASFRPTAPGYGGLVNRLALLLLLLGQLGLVSCDQQPEESVQLCDVQVSFHVESATEVLINQKRLPYRDFPSELDRLSELCGAPVFVLFTSSEFVPHAVSLEAMETLFESNSVGSVGFITESER